MHIIKLVKIIFQSILFMAGLMTVAAIQAGYYEMLLLFIPVGIMLMVLTIKCLHLEDELKENKIQTDRTKTL